MPDRQAPGSAAARIRASDQTAGPRICSPGEHPARADAGHRGQALELLEIPPAIRSTRSTLPQVTRPIAHHSSGYQP